MKLAEREKPLEKRGIVRQGKKDESWWGGLSKGWSGRGAVSFEPVNFAKFETVRRPWRLTL